MKVDQPYPKEVSLKYLFQNIWQREDWLNSQPNAHMLLLEDAIQQIRHLRKDNTDHFKLFTKTELVAPKNKSEFGQQKSGYKFKKLRHENKASSKGIHNEHIVTYWDGLQSAHIEEEMVELCNFELYSSYLNTPEIILKNITIKYQGEEYEAFARDNSLSWAEVYITASDLNKLDISIFDEENKTTNVAKKLSHRVLFKNPPIRETLQYEVIKAFADSFIEQNGKLPSKHELWTYMLKNASRLGFDVERNSIVGIGNNAVNFNRKHFNQRWKKWTENN